MVKVGIIGGSGLDNPDILKDARDLVVSTKYGEPRKHWRYFLERG